MAWYCTNRPYIPVKQARTVRSTATAATAIYYYSINLTLLFFALLLLLPRCCLLLITIITATNTKRWMIKTNQIDTIVVVAATINAFKQQHLYDQQQQHPYVWWHNKAKIHTGNWRHQWWNNNNNNNTCKRVWYSSNNNNNNN